MSSKSIYMGFDIGGLIDGSPDGKAPITLKSQEAEGAENVLKKEHRVSIVNIKPVIPTTIDELIDGIRDLERYYWGNWSKASVLYVHIVKRDGAYVCIARHQDFRDFGFMVSLLLNKPMTRPGMELTGKFYHWNAAFKALSDLTGIPENDLEGDVDGDGNVQIGLPKITFMEGHVRSHDEMVRVLEGLKEKVAEYHANNKFSIKSIWARFKSWLKGLCGC